ncbi:MAG: PQQ-binding-like beta-propeller repeat protein, partial [Planctomycetales bacterium]
MRTSRRRFSRSTLFLALCAAAPLAGFAAGQDTPRRATSEWPQYKGNSGFTGVSSDDSIKPPLKLRWSYRLDSDASGDAGAGLTVAGGKVFANLCYARAIVALEADSGRFLWEYDDTHIGYMTVPTWHDGRVLLWERGGPRNQAAIVALDDATGKVLWRRELNGEGIDPQRAGIPVADGRAFTSAGGPAPTVSAWDAKTGAPLWQTDLDPADGEFPRAPSVAAGRVIVAQRPVHPYRDSRAAGQKQPAGAVVALDAATGKVIWRRQGAYPQKALVSDGEVIACPMWAGPDEKFHLLDANTGETKWTLNKPHYYPSTILPDKILLKPYGPQFIAVDRATGKELWHFREKGNSGCCTPVVSGNYAYMGTGIPGPPGDLESLGSFQHLHAPREKGNSGALHAVDLRTGKSVWHFGTGNTVCGEPALAYGRVHIASRDGRVYCF